MEEKTNNKLLVFYVGVQMLEPEEISEFIQGVANKISPKIWDGEVIFIPQINSVETRVECINPQYITDAELIEKNQKLLEELKQELEIQLNEYKKLNNGE
jgi:hypothetical protein